MDLVVDRVAAAEALGRASRVASSEAGIGGSPNTTLLEVFGQSLRVTTATSYVQHSTDVAAKLVDRPGRLWVEPETLARILARAPGAEARLVGIRESGKVKLRVVSDRSSLVVPAQEDGVHRPGLEVVTQHGVAHVSSHRLVEALGRGGFAVTKDPTRQGFNGVLFESFGDGIRIASADGFRVVVADLGLRAESGRFVTPDGLLPPESARLLARFAGEWPTDSDVTLVTGDSGEPVAGLRSAGLLRVAGPLRADGGCEVLSFRMFAGAFVDFEGIYRKPRPVRVVVDAIPLLAAIKRMAIARPSGTAQVRVGYSPGEIEVEMFSDAMTAREIVAADVTGADKELKIAVSIVFLRDAVEAVADDRILVEVGAQNDPIAVRGARDVGLSGSVIAVASAPSY